MSREQHPEKTKAVALDWRRQKRQQDYLRLPQRKLVELLCDARYTILRRNQRIKTLEAALRNGQTYPAHEMGG